MFAVIGILAWLYCGVVAARYMQASSSDFGHRLADKVFFLGGPFSLAALFPPIPFSWRRLWTSANLFARSSWSRSDLSGWWSPSEPITWSPSAQIPFITLALPLTNPTGSPSEPERAPWPPVMVRGPVIGWRRFQCHLTHDGYKLYSLTAGCAWDGPAMQDDSLMLDVSFPLPYGPMPEPARGPKGNPLPVDQRLPGVGFFSYRARPLRWAEVMAEVENLGIVVEHEHGYRAQGQLIRRLYVRESDPRLIADLERRYQCEVVNEAGA